MRNLPRKKARWMRVRISALALALFGAATVVTWRGYDLMIERAPQLAEMAREQHLRHIRLAPKRGSIYDRNGAELAVSVDVESVWVNPRQLRASGGQPRQVARRLAALLQVDAEVLLRRFSSDRYFVWVKRRVSPRLAKVVRGLDIRGVHLSNESRRFYPNRQLAAHVLGFANVDGKGIEGLELRLEERLRGSVDTVPAIRDRRGHVVFSQQLLDDRAAQGDDVVLTIDKTIQHLAERELELAVRTFEARAGSVVVIDPRNGEILAMANFPTYNPNRPGSAKPSTRRNRAITDRFEPGSTVKPFTVAGALARGTVGPNQQIDCEGGKMMVGEDDKIHDTHKWDTLTPSEILAYSSNIGTAKIGMSLGRRGLFDVFTRFGFGARTGVELPGETAGILRHHKRWYELDAVTISFGQGMSSTTLQLAMGMGALANKGRLMRPMLVRRIEDARGETLERMNARLRRRVVPARVARLVADMLIGVTGEGGTAEDAAIEGYLTAGKTGTAQKADYVRGGYAKDRWMSSFVGFAPAKKPRLVTAVVIDEPVIAHYGGTVAGPVFRRVTEAALRHLGVPQDAAVPSALSKRGPRKKRNRAAKAAAKAVAGASTGADLLVPVAEGQVRVPDLSGRTARAALVAAREAQLQVRMQGTGLVSGQQPEAHAVVTRGALLRLELAPPGALHPEREVQLDGQEAAALPTRDNGARPRLAARGDDG